MSEHRRFSLFRYLRIASRSCVLALIVFLALAACVPAAPQDADQRSSPTPAEPQPWIASSLPITLETVTDIQPLGRLDQPDEVSTIMD
ncbi:MAG: hypothetical protein IH587_10250, partial [Anaerolineae bacterium]|nr:hypothetical protein [Anaerolineae bacterium]